MCVAAAIAGAAIIGGVASYAASDNAASAQKNAASQASATQMSMFNTIQGNEAPWVQTGQQANSALAQFYGLPGMSQSAAGSTGLMSNGPSGPGAAIAPGTGSQNNWTGVTNLGQKATAGQGMTAGGRPQPGQPAPTSGAPDYQKILSSLPGYQFQLQQGQLATQHNLAARGLLGSGAAEKSLDTFGQGLAQNYASQYTQGLQNLSQMGEAGAAGVATAGMNAANNVAGSQIYAGNAGAAGYMNQAGALNQGLSGLVGAYNNYNANQNAQYRQEQATFSGMQGYNIPDSGGGADPYVNAYWSP